MQPDVREKFIDYLKEQKALNQISVDSYLTELDRCRDEYGDDLHNIPDYDTAADLVIKIKKKYPGENGQPPLSSSTARKIATVLKVYFDFCARRKMMDPIHPFYEGHGFKNSKPPEPEFFDTQDPDDKKIILRVLWYPNLTLIWRAIIWTFYSTGIRRRELCGLNFEDIDLQKRMIHVRKEIAKKEHWRWVPYDKKTAILLEQHCGALKDEWPERIKAGKFPLFPTRKGERMQPGSVWKFLRRLKSRLDLKTNINPHKWRHSLAPRLLERMELTKVSRLMGHEDPKTTYQYTRYKNRTLRDGYDLAVEESLAPVALEA